MMGFHLFSKSTELTVDISPSVLTKEGANGELTTDTATGTGQGGTPPYTYAWSYVSGDSYTINNPSGAGTTFTASGTDEFKSGVYKVVVTDDDSNTAEDTVQVNFTFGNPP